MHMPHGVFEMKLKALAIGIIFLQKLSQSDKDFKRYELEEV